jgi:hypothetical protein
MEILSVLLIVAFLLIFLKIFSLLLNTGIFLLTLPIKILGALLSFFVVLVILLPLGIIGAIAGFLAVPFMIIVILLPVFLIGYGIFHLINRS